MKLQSTEMTRKELYEFLEQSEEGITIYAKDLNYIESLDFEQKDKIEETLYKIRTETGFVIFLGEKIHIIIPPFPVEENKFIDKIDTSHLEEILKRRYVLGVVLLRTGEYSLGVFDDRKLITSKTGGRYIKRKHKKGGWSQKRFSRLREEEIQKLFKEVCEQARKKFDGYKIDYLFLGGDRLTLKSFLRKCDYLNKFPRFKRILNVRHIKKKTLERVLEEIWKSKVYTIRI